MGWAELILAAFGGGAAFKVLEVLVTWYRDTRKAKKESAKAAKVVVDRHLDPILKAGDELVAKLRWSAQNDFKDLEALDFDARPLSTDVGALLFLLASFWARIQLLRQEGIYTNVGTDPLGKKLLTFVRTLEERETRLLERHVQRGIGELLLIQGHPSPRVMSFYEFVSAYEANPRILKWLQPLLDFLSRLRFKSERQQLLVYGAVVHALLDTLDIDGLITDERPGWGNKLTSSSRHRLDKRIFSTYLGLVRDPRKYFEPPSASKK